MAQYTMTYRCGHEEQTQLYGPTKGRERKIDWAKEALCPGCYCTQETKQRTAALASSGLALATFEGSSKQIEWATDIRARKLLELQRLLAKVQAGDKGIWDALLTRLAGERSAKFWIDHRDVSAQTLGRRVAQATGLIPVA